MKKLAILTATLIWSWVVSYSIIVPFSSSLDPQYWSGPCVFGFIFLFLALTIIHCIQIFNIRIVE